MKRLLYILIVVVFASCDYTDIQPKGEVLPDNAQALEGLLNYSYNQGGIKSTLFMCPDLKVPDGHKYTTNSDRNAYNWEKLIYENDAPPYETSALFEEINRYNIILDNFETSDGSEALKKVLQINALVKRALCSFNLINAYCPPYSKETASKAETGLKIIRTETYSGDLTRPGLQENYDEIIADLELAETIDVDEPQFSSRVTKYTAKGLLGMCYLQMGDYDKALGYFNEALAYRDYLKDYNEVPDGDFVTYFNGTQRHLNDETLGYTGASVMFYGGSWASWNPAMVNPDLVNLFTDDDLRKNFMENIFGVYYWFGAHGRVYAAGIDVPALLIWKAECLARAGSDQQALDVLNMIRAKRFKTGSDYMLELTDGDVLALVKEESARELRFTYHRWTNLRRWNTIDPDKTTFTRKHTLTGEEFTIEADNPRWTLAIPESMIYKNPEIKQNPR